MGTGIRETKRVQTRLALSRAAIELAAETGGPDEVTVDAIAERGGTSRRTFFNYFPSKEAAFVRPLYDVGARFATALADRDGDEPVWEAIRAALHATLSAPEADPGLIADIEAFLMTSPAIVLTTEAHTDGEPSAAQLHHIAKSKIAELTGGDPDRDVYAQLTSEAAGLALRVAARTWASAGGDPHRHVDTVVDMLRDGIRPPH